MEGLDKLPDSSTSSAQHKGRSASLSASIKGVLSKPRKEFRNDTYIHPNPSGSSMSGPSSLSDSRSHKEEDVETAHDEINRKSATSLQRAITTTSSNSGTSRDFKNASSLRVVGRGGQGSRPRQTKGEASGDNHDAWEPSHPTSAQGIDDHFTNARVTQSSTSKDGVRVVGRGGYGSKHRTPSLPSQPLTSVPQSPAITPKTPQSTSSAQQIRPIRLGGRGGAGSRPRASSLADSSSHPDSGMKSIVALKIRLKGKRRSKNSKSDDLASPPPLSPILHSPKSSLPSPILTEYHHRHHSTYPVPRVIDTQSLSPSHSGPPTPTQASSSSALASPSFSFDDAGTTPPSSSSSIPSRYDHSSLGPSKAERALGITSLGTLVDHHLPHDLSSINSFQIDPADFESMRYYRRASLPLSTIGSFIRAENVVLDSDDVEGEDCWIENKYESTSDKEGGSSTPVSSIMFADRPPSPQPPKRRRSASASLVDAGTGLVLLRSAAHHRHSAILPLDNYSDYTNSPSEEVGGHLDESASFDSSLYTSDQPSLDLTPDTPPDTPHMLPSPGTPVSPMIFSERHSVFLPTGSKENLQLLQVRDPSALDLSAPTLPTIPSRRSLRTTGPPRPPKPLTRADTERYVRPDSPFMDYRTTNTFHSTFDRRPRVQSSNGRTELAEGWSGQWNRNDIQDVIDSLRMLK